MPSGVREIAMVTEASCSKCNFFDVAARDGATTRSTDGLCRFNPPVTQPGPDEHGLWPVVSISDWCGHYEAASGLVQVAAE